MVFLGGEKGLYFICELRILFHNFRTIFFTKEVIMFKTYSLIAIVFISISTIAFGQWEPIDPRLPRRMFRPPHNLEDIELNLIILDSLINDLSSLVDSMVVYQSQSVNLMNSLNNTSNNLFESNVKLSKQLVILTESNQNSSRAMEALTNKILWLTLVMVVLTVVNIGLVFVSYISHRSHSKLKKID